MAVWCLRFGAAAIKRAHLVGAEHHGQLARDVNGLHLGQHLARSSVTSKKNFSPVMVALIVIGEVPVSTRCS